MIIEIISFGYLLVAIFYLVLHLGVSTLYLGADSLIFWIIDLYLLLFLCVNFYFFDYARTKSRQNWLYLGGAVLSLVLHYHLVYLSVALYSYSVSRPLPYTALIWGLFSVTLVSLGGYYLLRLIIFDKTAVIILGVLGLTVASLWIWTPRLMMWITLLLLLPLGIILGIGSLSFDAFRATTFQFIHIPFNQSAWASGYGRYWMLADLNEHHSLAYMSETEMISLLGNPSKRGPYFDSSYYYVVATAPIGRRITFDYDEDARQRIKLDDSTVSWTWCSDMILRFLTC